MHFAQELYLVCLSATLEAPKDSGLILATKPEPVTIPTISLIKFLVSPVLPMSTWTSSFTFSNNPLVAKNP